MGKSLMVLFYVYLDDNGQPRWHAYAYDWAVDGTRPDQAATPVLEVLGAHSQREAAEEMGYKLIERGR